MSKQRPRKPPKTDPEKKAGFGKSFAQMLFIVAGALGGFYSVFLALTPKRGDTTNEYIAENLPRLLTWEWILFSVIVAGFLYFAFKWVFKAERKIYDYVALGLVFLAINGLFVLSFDKDLGSFGDNAQYIVHSKSLLEKGGPYNIYFINEAYKAKAPLGLPMMLAPITAMFGMDVFKMKALIFIMGALSLLFFYGSFRKLTDRNLAALVTILAGTFPLFVYNTSYVMTEVPFVFTMSVALYCALKLRESERTRQVVLWSVFTVLTVFFTYMTRAVGAAIIAAVIAWLFFQVPWLDILKKKSQWLQLSTKKFVGVSMALVFLFLGWQVKTSMAVKRDQQERAAQVEAVEGENAQAEEDQQKSSQLSQYLSTDLIERLSTNYKKVGGLWSQQLFNKKLSRWYFSLGKAASVEKVNAGMRFFNFLLFISLLVGLARRDLIAFAFLFLGLVTLSGTATPVLMVYSRYFIPFVPFMIYLMVRLLPDIAAFFGRKKPMPVVEGMATLAATVFLFIMLHHNFSGNAFNIQRQNSGDAYTIAFDNYLKTGTWIKENLPEDVIVASRKPRLFYVFSERKGVYTVTYANQAYSKELEADRIAFFIEKGVDYVVLDAFSTASRKVILPIIQNNPDKFQVVQSVGEKYPSHVVRFIH